MKVGKTIGLNLNETTEIIILLDKISENQFIHPKIEIQGFKNIKSDIMEIKYVGKNETPKSVIEITIDRYSPQNINLSPDQINFRINYFIELMATDSTKIQKLLGSKSEEEEAFHFAIASAKNIFGKVEIYNPAQSSKRFGSEFDIWKEHLTAIHINTKSNITSKYNLPQKLEEFIEKTYQISGLIQEIKETYHL